VYSEVEATTRLPPSERNLYLRLTGNNTTAAQKRPSVSTTERFDKVATVAGVQDPSGSMPASTGGTPPTEGALKALGTSTPAADLSKQAEQSMGGSSGRSAMTNQPSGGSGDQPSTGPKTAGLDSKGPAPVAVERLRQGLGEPRSSSGECTSGDSQSEKNAAQDGSPKDSGSQEEDELPAGKSDNRKKSLLPSSEAIVSEGLKDPKCVITAATEAEGEAGQEDEGAGGDKSDAKGNRPKLPKPVGICKCPRCDSEDTKFCYYNNYQIKQPRYYCKGCQRYWTQGGTLRNVPVGSGRRNKSSTKDAERRRHVASDPTMGGAMGRSPMGGMLPPVGMAGAYAHNRHVLWDPEASMDTCGGKMTEMPPGIPPHAAFMPPGMPPMGHMHPQPGMRGHPMMLHMAGMPPQPGMSPMRGMPPMPNVPEATRSSEDARPRQRQRRGSPDPSTSRFMQQQPHMDVKPHMELPAGYHPPGPRMGGAEAGPGNPMLGKQAAAAAAAAAYQAAATGQHPPYGWPGMSAWHHHYPWGNSAVAAGWAAAAAAAYGQAGSGHWPHGSQAGWGQDGSGGCPPGVSASPGSAPGQQGAPSQGPQASSAYMGYPGPSPSGWPHHGWGPSGAPGGPMPHPGQQGMHPGQQQGGTGQPPMGMMPPSMMAHQYGLDFCNGGVPSGGSGQSSHTMALGKHSRSYDS